MHTEICVARLHCLDERELVLVDLDEQRYLMLGARFLLEQPRRELRLAHSVGRLGDLCKGNTGMPAQLFHNRLADGLVIVLVLLLDALARPVNEDLVRAELEVLGDAKRDEMLMAVNETVNDPFDAQPTIPLQQRKAERGRARR